MSSLLSSGLGLNAWLESMSDQQKAFVLEAIKTVGYPIFVSLALGFALFGVGKSQLDRQTKFIDAIELTAQQQATSLHAVSDSIHQTNLLLEQLKTLFTVEHEKTRQNQSGEHEKTRQAIIDDNNRLIEYADKLHEESRRILREEMKQP